jgi:DNA-binding NtrC family response regulator
MRVLVVENAPRQQQVIVAALQTAGYDVTAVTRPSQARAALNDAAQEFAAVVIEESIRGGKGLQLLRETRVKRGELPVVIVSRDGNWRSYAQALGMHALAYLPQPVNPARLVSALEEVLKPTRPQNRNGKPARRRT